MKKIVLVFLKTIIFMLILVCVDINVYAVTQNTTKTTFTKLSEKAEGKVYVSWNKKSVDGYQIRWSLSSSMSSAKSASTIKTYFSRSGLIGGKTYYFQVRTYKLNNGKKSYSGWSAVKSIKLKKLPTATTITSLTSNSRNGFTVKWKKQSSVKGYQIRYSTDPLFKTKKTASTIYSSISRNNLIKGTYYVSVRTYNTTAGGIKYYSGWSTTKSVRVGETAQSSYVKVGEYIYNYGTDPYQKDRVNIYSYNEGTISFSIEHEETDKSIPNETDWYYTDTITTRIIDNKTGTFQWNDNWDNSGTGSLVFGDGYLTVQMKIIKQGYNNAWEWWNKSPKMRYQGQPKNATFYYGQLGGMKSANGGTIVSVNVNGRTVTMYASFRKVIGYSGTFSDPSQYMNYTFEIAENAIFYGGGYYWKEYLTYTEFLRSCQNFNGLLLILKVEDGKVVEAKFAS